jgi:hypothetical protein
MEIPISLSLENLVGIYSISGAEVIGLPNQTAAIPNSSDKCVIELDVFHRLNCLNALRKTLYPDRYGPFGAYEDWLDENGRRKYTGVAAHHYGI